jgi:hypothetical protein
VAKASAKKPIMGNSAFISGIGAAFNSYITLFDRGIRQPQERSNHTSPGRLRRREDELRAVNCTAVIGSGEVNNGSATNGCTNDGDDMNDAANHLIPIPLSGFQRA